MNKEQFDKVKVSVIEIVGFVGVIGSLIFVGIQIRQNTIASRANAYQQMGAAVADIWFSTAQEPARAAMTMRFFEEPNAAFTPVEEAVLINQSIAAYRQQDRKSTRLNSSHLVISYAVFCLKKKNKKK